MIFIYNNLIYILNYTLSSTQKRLPGCAERIAGVGKMFLGLLRGLFGGEAFPVLLLPEVHPSGVLDEMEDADAAIEVGLVAGIRGTDYRQEGLDNGTARIGCAALMEGLVEGVFVLGECLELFFGHSACVIN